MNKASLIEYIAEHADVASKASAKRIVDDLFAYLAQCINNGEVSISGLGSFYTVTREAREGRNPQTGDVIQVPTRRIPKFRPSPKLKEIVN